VKGGYFYYQAHVRIFNAITLKMSLGKIFIAGLQLMALLLIPQNNNKEVL